MVNSPHLGAGGSFRGGNVPPVLPERRDLTLRGRWRRVLFISQKPSFWWKMARLSLFITLLAGGYTAWVYKQPVSNWLEVQIAQATGATVQKIEIEGAVHTRKDELQQALNLQKGASLVTYNTSAARQRLEALPWVRMASVERQLPDTLKVSLYEHTPLARVEADGQYWVANREGTLIAPDTTAQFSHLPLLHGVGAPTQAATLLGLMSAFPNLSQQLHQATWVGNRRWDLTFTSGVMVRLPEGDATAAIARLAELEQQRHVLSLPAGEVDLRLSDRIILRLPKNITTTPVVNAPQGSAQVSNPATAP